MDMMWRPAIRIVRNMHVFVCSAPPPLSLCLLLRLARLEETVPKQPHTTQCAQHRQHQHRHEQRKVGFRLGELLCLLGGLRAGRACHLLGVIQIVKRLDANRCDGDGKCDYVRL